MNSHQDPDTPTPSYTMGYSDEFAKLLDRRNSGINAAHLLPHLKPGLRVLDLGCGPGTISVGLAKVVEPGELHGIDMEESQIKIARAAATAGGHDNAVFRTGDATRLPFVSNRGGSHQTRAGNSGAVRELAPIVGAMEGFPGCGRCHRLGRGDRPKAIVAPASWAGFSRRAASL